MVRNHKENKAPNSIKPLFMKLNKAVQTFISQINILCLKIVLFLAVIALAKEEPKAK